MKDYQHLLLAVDYSEHCDFIAHKALHLAKLYQAQLSIVHVLDNIAMPDTTYGMIIPLNEKTDYQALEEEKMRFQHIADKLHIDPANRWLVWGPPKQEIINIADNKNVDLIILGSHGRHGLALLLGSTANAVLHYAKCDVMAVRIPE